jgi:hypothetical protein
MTRSAQCLAFGLLAWLATAQVGAAAEPSPWEIPPEGSCASASRLRGWPLGEDAAPFELKVGEVIDGKRMQQIQRYLPPPIWENRERFLFEGMQLEIGPCFRDYSPPASFAAATEKFRGQAHLLADGGLADHVAGLPFPPDAIARDDSQAGAMWAWNFVSRWRAAGFRGKFRTVDLIGSSGAEPFEGEIWQRELGWRADRAADGYRIPDTGTLLWVAGGRFMEPFNAREFAWQQYRDVASAAEAARSDDLHMYVATMRRVRRVDSSGIDGLFVPSFSIGMSAVDPSPKAQSAEASAALGNSNSADLTTISPKRSGFEGLELRPQFLVFRALGTQDVLAPINTVKAGYPAEPQRDFGPYGLSWASDRWDLRRALVLEGVPRQGIERGDPDLGRVELWLDLQTLYPLCYASYDAKGQPIDVGYYVGRWSEDRAEYPKDPNEGGGAPRVIDPVGEAFANLRLRAGWRRESWEFVSAPEADRAVRHAVSLKNLNKGK